MIRISDHGLGFHVGQTDASIQSKTLFGKKLLQILSGRGPFPLRHFTSGVSALSA